MYEILYSNNIRKHALLQIPRIFQDYMKSIEKYTANIRNGSSNKQSNIKKYVYVFDKRRKKQIRRKIVAHFSPEIEILWVI